MLFRVWGALNLNPRIQLPLACRSTWAAQAHAAGCSGLRKWACVGGMFAVLCNKQAVSWSLWGGEGGVGGES